MVRQSAVLYWEGADAAFARPQRWTWRLAGTQPQDSLALGPPAAGRGEALLTWLGASKQHSDQRPCRWTFRPCLPLGGQVVLAPVDGQWWHPFTFVTTDPKDSPVPILRQDALSTHYPDLLALVQDLTAPYFQGIVRHWPDWPVPVRVGDYRSGAVNLSACLAAAVRTWNAGEKDPWFRFEEQADWGVRLVHYPLALLCPPLRTQLTRIDASGDPVRMNILVGMNYTDATDSVYVVRGMVHELGHCLLLWGHSPDRIHSLWGAAPPLVDAPSLDERKAARLLRGLPEGLDLGRYDRFNGS